MLLLLFSSTRTSTITVISLFSSGSTGCKVKSASDGNMRCSLMFAFRYFCKGVLRDMLVVQTGGFRGGSEVQGQACTSQAFDCKVALRRKAALSSKKSCFHPQCRLRSPERKQDQCSSEQLPAAGDELSSIVWLTEAAGAQNRVLRGLSLRPPSLEAAVFLRSPAFSKSLHRRPKQRTVIFVGSLWACCPQRRMQRDTVIHLPAI